MRYSAKLIGLLTLATVLYAPQDLPLSRTLVPLAVAQENSATDRQAEATELFNQGGQQFSQNQLQEALHSWSQALQIYQDIGDVDNQIFVLTNMGLAYQTLGQYERAISSFEDLLVIVRELKESQGASEELKAEEGRIIGQLGLLHREFGQYEQAVEFLEQRIEIAREIGDRAGEGAGLGNLGSAYDGLGQYEQAIDAYEQRLIITRELGQRDRESLTLGNLAETYIVLGEIQTAVELLQQALEIAREIGDSEQEVRILKRLQSLADFSANSETVFLNIEGTLDENSEEITQRFDDETPDLRLAIEAHQIVGKSGQVVTIRMQSDGFIPRILLLDVEANALIAESFPENTLQNDVWLVVTLPQDGIYEVYATTHQENIQGSYQLEVSEAETADLIFSDATNLYRQALEQSDLENYQAALQLYEQSLNFYRSEAVRTKFSTLSLRQEAFLWRCSVAG